MRFSCLSGVAPASSIEEQCAWIAAAGCAGVDTIVFPHDSLESWQSRVAAAAKNSSLDVVSVIIGGLALHRRDQSAYLREAVHAIAGLNAMALVTPEYEPQSPLPLFPPFAAPGAEERWQVERGLAVLSEAAAQHGVTVCVEPITQFESRHCRDVAGALNLIASLNNPLMKLALDTHNMNITEACIADSIRMAGNRIGHVHLADSNRLLPGKGHIDFAGVFTALRGAGYAGGFSFECGVLGDFTAEISACIGMLRAKATPFL
jgi:sugar phosphate isomerase/epimerase